MPTPAHVRPTSDAGPAVRAGAAVRRFGADTRASAAARSGVVVVVLIAAGIAAAEMGNRIATRAFRTAVPAGEIARADGVTTRVAGAPGQPGYVGAPPRGTAGARADGRGGGGTGRERASPRPTEHTSRR